ncbi:MAG: hypothetical protein AAGF11_52150 [Myxococcota bacterium]
MCSHRSRTEPNLRQGPKRRPGLGLGLDLSLGLGLGLGLLLGSAACDTAHGHDPFDDDIEFRAQNKNKNKPPKFNVGARNLHLEPGAVFEPAAPMSDADRGRALFGLAADLNTADPTQALFEGDSAFAGPIVSNGRTCFTCHRGIDIDLGMPPLPLSSSVPMDDPLFTGIDGDAQGDPDAMFNLDQLGLFKIRPNRFNPTRDFDDPFIQVFAWRKSPTLLNVGFSHGLLHDLRGRAMFEVARGAAFSHPQEGNIPFDDLFFEDDGNDLAAFLFGQVTDPALLPLRDPTDPGYAALVEDPFATVPVTTKAQKKGKKLFKKFCMACHGTPNVFNDAAHVRPLGRGERPSTFPTWAPAVGRGYDIGVSHLNTHNLRFTRKMPDGSNQPITLPLAAEDGTLVEYDVYIDVGLAATTGRYEDIARFKSPQLRNVAAHAPYFHDNSIDTLEEVVDYFCSNAYNNSKDGMLYPIHMSSKQRQRLVAFLEIL